VSAAAVSSLCYLEPHLAWLLPLTRPPPRSYGYDPLGLGKDGNVEKYREYELIHGRWAMLGAFGAVLPELIDVNGGNIPGAVWWQARTRASFRVPSGCKSAAAALCVRGAGPPSCQSLL